MPVQPALFLQYGGSTAMHLSNSSSEVFGGLYHMVSSGGGAQREALISPLRCLATAPEGMV